MVYDIYIYIPNTYFSTIGFLKLLHESWRQKKMFTSHYLLGIVFKSEIQTCWIRSSSIENFFIPLTLRYRGQPDLIPVPEKGFGVQSLFFIVVLAQHLKMLVLLSLMMQFCYSYSYIWASCKPRNRSGCLSRVFLGSSKSRFVFLTSSLTEGKEKDEFQEIR